jgi:signal transduction histidine kinase/CheY-like chemotaxis protein
MTTRMTDRLLRIQNLPLWGLTICVLLTCAVWIGWSAYADYRRNVEKEFKQIELFARYREARISGSLRTVNLMLTNIASDLAAMPTKSGGPADALLTGYARNLPELRLLHTTDPHGRVNASSNSETIGFDGSQREYFTSHVAAPADLRFHISRPFITKRGAFVITISRVLQDSQGKFGGALVATIDASLFEAALKFLEPTPDGVSLIIHRSGDVVYSTAGKVQWVGANLVGGIAYTEHMQARREQTRHLNRTKHTNIMRMAAFLDVPGTPLIIVVSRDYDILLAEWRQSMWIQALSFLLIAASTICLSWLASRRQRVLAEARNFAEQANRAKSHFLASMSHELRTPMSAVLGMLQLLRRTELSPVQDDYVSKSQSAAQSLIAILNDILDFSKIESGRFTLESQSFLLDDVLRDLSVIVSASAADKDILLAFDIGVDVPARLEGDSLRLKQVLINLCGNAVKFTERGAVVLTLARAVDAQGQARLSFAVRDTGIGIPPDKQAHIFEGFSQADESTSRRFGGTGLGLSISKRLVEMMGGQLHVTSAEGAGSCFTFSLPLRAHEAPAILDAEPVAAPLQVLVVDPDQTRCSLIGRYADALGWTVEFAATGADGIARAASGHFALVLVHWRLPDMDALAFQAQLRRDDAGAVPVLVMANAHWRVDLMEKLEAARCGPVGFLIQPFTPTMLRDAAAAQQPDPAQGAQLAPAQRMQRLAGLNLLLVEDNLLIQHVTAALLNQEGANVAVAGDGQAAITALEGASFDAVIMDVQMPVMDGYTATRLIRSVLGRNDLFIVAMTANAMDGDRELALAAGMNTYLSKPLELDLLVETILGRHQPGPGAGAAAPPAPAQGTPALPVLDCEAAMARLGDSANLFDQIVAMFIAELEAFPTALARSRDEGPEAMLRFLHTLGGNAATVGAVALAARVREIVAELRAGAPGLDVVSIADRLADEIVTVANALRARTPSHGDTPG